MSLKSNLRSYTLTQRGHFHGSHFLPGYHGDCANVHGHTWHVQVVIEFPVIDVQLLTGEHSDGMLVDYHDIEQVWYELDHGRAHPKEGLNAVFEHPTAEVISNWLLEQLCGLVEDQVPDTPFHVTVTLEEDEDTSCVCSMYMAPFIQGFPDGTDVEEVLRSLPKAPIVAGDRDCDCECCREERDMPREASPTMPRGRREHERQQAHRRIADTVTSL